MISEREMLGLVEYLTHLQDGEPSVFSIEFVRELSALEVVADADAQSYKDLRLSRYDDGFVLPSNGGNDDEKWK